MRGDEGVYTPLMPFRTFIDIGFACNPFRALERGEWVRAAVIPGAVRRAVQAGGHLQILGPAGSGKTTTLLALEDEFRRAGRTCAYEYIPPKANRFRTETKELDVFLLDEAQRLSGRILFFGRQRARLARAAQAGTRLVLGSHDELADIFRAADMPLQTLRLEPPGAGRLAEILERRLSLFANRTDRAMFSEEALLWLLRNFGEDLRTMEYFLYEFFQTARPEGIIRAAELRLALPSFTPPAAGQQ
jgi:chromosomal replication initiation ATPase DnaA